MERIKQVTPEAANPDLKKLYDTLNKKMEKVFNIFQNMGNSIPTLQAYLNMNEMVGKTSLPQQLREKIALTVAQTNNCGYCLSAHSQMAKGEGIPEVEIISARKGESNDPKTQAVLKLTKKIVEKRGLVSDEEIAEAKKAGINDQEIVEIVLNVVVNIFINYINTVTGTINDFPKTAELE